LLLFIVGSYEIRANILEIVTRLLEGKQDTPIAQVVITYLLVIEQEDI
jgi:hypothetical protein